MANRMSSLLGNLLCLLIAIFVTQSARLVLMPISDTERMVLLSILIFSINILYIKRIHITFFKRILPIILPLLFASFIDFLLGRFQFYSLVFWVKVASLILVGSVVYSIDSKLIQRIVIMSGVILALQFIAFQTHPGYFSKIGLILGIQDPFTIYGVTSERIYYAYFQSNIAAYTIFYMTLSWMIITRFGEYPSAFNLGILFVLVVFSASTGSRGVVIMTACIMLINILYMKSLRTIFILFAMPILLVMIVPLYNSVYEFVMLRQQSNLARLDAIQLYLSMIGNDIAFGVGYDYLRYRVDYLGEKPSHVFFIEVFATYGLFIGGWLIYGLIYLFVVQPKHMFIKYIGIIILLVGIFKNAIMTLPTFFPLLVPVMLKFLSWKASDNKFSQLPECNISSHTETYRELNIKRHNMFGTNKIG